jgi:hypothetical protein
VPIERGKAFFQAAEEPKTIRWYPAGHGLNPQAKIDRLEWLTHQLNV